MIVNESFASKIDSNHRIVTPKTRICQGDVFRDFSFSVFFGVDNPIIEGGDQFRTKVYQSNLGYFVVLSQDCDLDLDRQERTTPDKDQPKDKLLNILVCPAYIAEDLKEGKHIVGGMHRDKQNSSLWSPIKSNQNQRYHKLSAVNSLAVPDLVLDFKDYYTIPTQMLYDNIENYVYTVEELFREQVSQRFANYISRIGLPKLPSIE